MADLDCYVRVSRVSGRAGDSFISPALQRERCEQHAALHAHRIIQVHEELDVSGGRDDRPLWQHMLRRVESGETGGVIVARIDRFSRSLVGALNAIERLETAGGVIISVNEQFDTTTPMGRAVMRILLVIAELYREEAAKGFRVSRERAVERGVHITTRPPFGYRRGADGRMEPDANAPLVTEMFDRRAAGEALAVIATWLNDAKVTTALGGRWTSAAVLQLLENPAYTGQARSGDIVNETAHPALTDVDTFEAAQLAKTRSGHRQRRSLLAGLVRCAGCRYSLTGGGTRNYYCHRKHGAGICGEPAQVSQRLLDEHVTDAFFDRIGQLDFGVQERDEQLVAVRAVLAKSERELMLWRDDQEIQELGRDVYVAGLRTRAESRDRAQSDVTRMVAERATHAQLPLDPVALAELWPTLSTAERREVMAGAITCVFLRRGRGNVAGRVHFVWRGDPAVELPRPARMGEIRSFVFPGDDKG